MQGLHGVCNSFIVPPAPVQAFHIVLNTENCNLKYKSMFPSPSQVGLPSKFQVWRPNQPRAIKDMIECPKRVKILVQGPGEGKTAAYVAGVLMQPSKRAMILTVNKSLQDQLLTDFAEIGLADVRGKSSYDCQGRPDHNCEAGMLAKCAFKGSGICPWSAAIQAISDSRLGTTNYACWLAANKYGQGLGKFDILVMDEAHEAPDQLARAMQIIVGASDLELIQYDWPDHRKRGDMDAWKHWALVGGNIAGKRLEEQEREIERSESKPSRASIDLLRQYKNVNRKLADIAVAKTSNWVVDECTHGYQFDPIDPSVSAERFLLNKIESIVLVSGTMNPRIPEQLGFTKDDYEYFEYPKLINVSRTPLYYLPTIKVKKSTPDWEFKREVIKVADRIMESRMDRKGIFPTANSHLRDLIMEHSKFKKYMVTNPTRNRFGGQTTGQLIEAFRHLKPPAWFVSPSIGTGIDLPHDCCRCTIIVKLPFGDSATSKVERVRADLDPMKGIADMWSRLGQQFGRGDRGDPDDWQEVFILDELFGWVKWKFADLAPTGLLSYYKPIDRIPDPPEID